MDNIEDIVIPIFIVLLFVIKAISSAFGKKEEERPPEREVDENTRRIQEEIRRRIIERQQGVEREELGRSPYRDLETETVEEPIVQRWSGEEHYPRHSYEEVPAPPEPEPLWATPAVRDYEWELQKERERLERAKAARREALNRERLQVIRSAQKVANAVDSTAFRRRLVNDLKGRESLKRAFVLKEILDKPVSERWN